MEVVQILWKTGIRAKRTHLQIGMDEFAAALGETPKQPYALYGGASLILYTFRSTGQPHISKQQHVIGAAIRSS